METQTIMMTVTHEIMVIQEEETIQAMVGQMVLVVLLVVTVMTTMTTNQAMAIMEIVAILMTTTLAILTAATIQAMAILTVILKTRPNMLGKLLYSHHLIMQQILPEQRP